MERPSDHYYQLHQLMTRKLAGKISSEDDVYLNQLMEESPEARELWVQIRGMFTQEDLESNFSRHENREWVDFKELLQYSRRRRLRRTIRFAGLAAAAMAGIILLIYTLFNKPIQTPQLAAESAKTIQLKLANGSVIHFTENWDSIQTANALLNNTNNSLTYTANKSTDGLNSLIIPNGRNYHVILSDGTEVWLNAATTLKFPFNFPGTTREIAINGEAYIKVAKNPKKPFIVHLIKASQKTSLPPEKNREAASTSVQVLGTEFNVNSYDSSALSVALVAGSVKFLVPGEELVIKPGTEARYIEKKGITTQLFDEDEVLGWREGRYYIYESKVKDLSRELLRLYNIKVVVDNPVVEDRKFTGVLDSNKPVSHFLEYLRQTLKIDYYFDKEGILHFK